MADAGTAERSGNRVANRAALAPAGDQSVHGLRSPGWFPSLMIPVLNVSSKLISCAILLEAAQLARVGLTAEPSRICQAVVRRLATQAPEHTLRCAVRLAQAG